MIDTGSNCSFINPNSLKYLKPIKIQPIEIKTLFTTQTIDQKTILRGLPELQSKQDLPFLIFRFHNYFDGLIGTDIIKQLGIVIDIKNSKLKCDNFYIPIHFKPNLMSRFYEVPSLSKQICYLPVDVENGSIHIKPTCLTSDLFVPEGLYYAQNWYSYIEVINKSSIPQTFVIEQPIKADSTENYRELHSFSITSVNTSEVNFKDLLRTEHLNKEEKSLLFNICHEYRDVFFQEGEKLTFSNTIKHEITTKDDVPIYCKSYRYPYVHKEEVNRQINELLNQGIIRTSYSPWSAPIWIVPKKKDSTGKEKWRLVIDYRKLNEKTIDDRYPIPNITDILDKLGRSIYFSTIDLASGFHQVEINSKDIPKTAFSVENGHYEFVRMPFGLKNAPSTFQRVMDNVLRDLQGKVCLVYMDDIIVFSTSLQEHLENLKSVFKKLRESNLKIQINKSEFLRKEVSFLGHIVTSDGIKPNPDKTSAVKDFPIPRTPKQIKSFLGLLGYYRKFIKDFSNLTKPLTECLRKGKTIKLTPSFINCFDHCKNILCNDPILKYPDFSKPFNVTSDASNVALGAVLSQGPVGSDKPICYASRTLSKSEQNYSTIEKELLGIVWATKYFRPYIYGRKFKIITDHKPLTWLFSLKEPNSKLVRWRLKLEEFDYEIIHKNGRLNTNADALSRIEINTNEINLDVLETESLKSISMQNNIDISEKVSTVHSGEENMNDHISISERPINEFSSQIIITQNTKKTEISTKLKILFKRKKRYIIELKNTCNEADIISIFKNYLNSKRLTAVLTDDNTFRVIQSVYSNYFNHSKIKLVRSTVLLKDVIERDDQEKLVREYHENWHHRGITESLDHLKRNFYFPNMKHIISTVISNCDTCQRLKYDRNKEQIKLELTETPSKPLEIIHIDVYSIHKEHFLTVLDKFSKFAAVYMLTARTSINLIKSLRHYFSHHGLPKKIVCDNGSEFVSTLFKEFLELYNIVQHTICAKTSNGNSPVERFHSTLTELIRIIRSQKKDMHIGEIVDEAVLTYNNSIHSTTKFTPFEALTGHYNKNQPFPSNPEHITKQDYLKTHKENYEKLAKIIHDRSLEKKQNYITKLNTRRKDPPNYTQGETIYELDDRRDKLAARFNKHIVQKNNRVTVETPRRKVHKQKIRKKKL